MHDSKNLSLLFLQCPVPAWPDFGHERPPAPASRPSMALGAVHTPTICSVAEHTPAAPRRSAGAHTPMSPWRVFPTAMWTRSSQRPPKWHARVHSALYPVHLNPIIPHYIYTQVASLHLSNLYPSSICHALSSALFLAERSQVIPPCDFALSSLSLPIPSSI